MTRIIVFRLNNIVAVLFSAYTQLIFCNKNTNYFGTNYLTAETFVENDKIVNLDFHFFFISF